VPATTLAGAIDQLGTIDFGIRTKASRFVRRAPAAQAVPALVQAATKHKDGYVRFRALVLLAGFGDPQVRAVMLPAIDDQNDRLREVAYAYFERNPDPSLAPKLIAKLETEQSEFVRPSLIHALAAVVIICVWIVHVYAAIWVRGTIRAMVKGSVTGGWAWRHHRKWLRELVTGKRDDKGTGAKPAE